MQKRRPLGVTVLAIWALVASGFTFFTAFQFYVIFDYFVRQDGRPLDSVWYDLNLVSAISSVGGFFTAPLGKGITSILVNSPAVYANPAVTMPLFLSLGVLYALIGLFTLKPSRIAWLGNVSVSIVAAVALPISLFNFYTYTQGNIDRVAETIGLEVFLAWSIFDYLVYSAGVGIRLYYLFRPHVREFFGVESLFVQKRVT